MQGANLQTIKLRDTNGCRKYITPSERKRFLWSASSLGDPVKQLYCEVLYYTGCRPGEAYCLSLSSFDLAERVIVIETLKQRKKGIFRAIPVPADWLKHAVKILSRYVQHHRHESIWGFSEKTGYRVVKKVMAMAEIKGPHACPKGLRHGFCIAHAQAKTNPRLIQRWAGHASLATTMIYLDAQGQEERNAAKACW